MRAAWDVDQTGPCERIGGRAHGVDSAWSGRRMEDTWSARAAKYAAPQHAQSHPCERPPGWCGPGQGPQQCAGDSPPMLAPALVCCSGMVRASGTQAMVREAATPVWVACRCATAGVCVCVRACLAERGSSGSLPTGLAPAWLAQQHWPLHHRPATRACCPAAGHLQDMIAICVATHRSERPCRHAPLVWGS
eukprot:199019-Chlamydomonas_euryale.AAC.2